jgi:HK97 family phage major capsid protein
MSDNRSEVRALADAIDAKKADAATKWAAFDQARKSAREEGVDFATNTEAFEKVDTLSKAYDAVRDEITDLEQRLAKARGWSSDGPAPVSKRDMEERKEQVLSVARKVLDSEQYAALKASGALDNRDVMFGSTGAIKALSRAELKTLITSAAGSAGDLVVNDRKDIITLTPKANLSVLDVVTVGSTDSDTVEWIQETTYTNAAAETAEDTAAPESALVYEDVTSLVKDITTFIPATKRILADAGQLETLVNQRLGYMVRSRLQSQIIAGDGLGENLTGLVNTIGISAQALGADSRADCVHKGITKIRVAAEGVFEPSVLGIHPNDAEQLFLEKDVNGVYMFGGPGGNPSRTVWGLNPIVHVAFPEGNPVVGDFSQALLWLREGLSISMSDSHSDYFVKRKVAMLAVIRAAFGVVQPKAFCELSGF